jgi:4-amino-4-deoxy-L-arabinose transferase-like glycosyltransferase
MIKLNQQCEQYWKYLLAFLFCGALVVRLLFFIISPISIQSQPIRVVQNLLAGNGYVEFGNTPTAFLPPLYPLFQVPCWWIGGEKGEYIVISFQILMSLITVCLTADIGKRLACPLVGFFAGLHMLFNPWEIKNGQILESTTLEVLLFSVVLWTMVRARGTDHETKSIYYWLIISGMFSGLLALSRPMLIPFLSIVPLLFLLKIKGVKTVSLGTVVFNGCALLIGLTWTVRNALVYQEFIPVSLNFGYNLAIGNNPMASGGLYTNEGVILERFQFLEENERRMIFNLPLPERDNQLKEYGISQIKSDPGLFVYRIPKRWYALMWFDEPMIAKTTSPTVRLAGKMFMTITYSLIIIGIFHAWHRGYYFLLLFIALEVIWALLFYSFFFGQHRFRSWLHPSFALMAGLGFVSIIGWIYQFVMSKLKIKPDDSNTSHSSDIFPRTS